MLPFTIFTSPYLITWRCAFYHFPILERHLAYRFSQSQVTSGLPFGRYCCLILPAGWPFSTRYRHLVCEVTISALLAPLLAYPFLPFPRA